MTKLITLINAMPPVSETMRFTPLGPLCLAAVLEQNGYQVDLRDYQLCPKADCGTVGQFLGLLENTAPIVGISCWINTLPLVLTATKLLKEQEPNKVLILGGAAASASADALLMAFPHIDVIVRGEGEETILDLMLALDKGDYSDVQGISYRTGTIIRHNPSRPRISDLDRLPLPAYDKLDWDCYNIGSIVTARGCPFRCTFCDLAEIWGHQCFNRSLSRVMQEIQLLRKRYGIRRIDLADDSFGLKRSRVLEFCRLLQQDRMDVQWNCYARVDYVDEILLTEMGHANCTGILFGIESGSPHTLARVQKNISVTQAEEIVCSATHYVPWIDASYIWGFPFETMEDFSLTVRSAARMATMAQIDVSLRQLAPTPLSPIYAEYKHTLRAPDADYLDLCTNMPMQEVWHEVLQGGLANPVYEHPAVFTPFYYYDCLDLPEKLALIARSTTLSEHWLGRLNNDTLFQSTFITNPSGILAQLQATGLDDETRLAFLQLRARLKSARYSRNWTNSG